MRVSCLRAAFVAAVLISLLLPRGDRLHLTNADVAAQGHRYGLVSWEAANFPAKWLHRLYTMMPWNDTSAARRRAELDEFLVIAERIQEAQGRLADALSADTPDSTVIASAQQELDSLYGERNRVRDGVEEYLESALSDVLVDVGLNAAGSFIWPPVDFRLDETPNVLIASPRDHIERTGAVLLAARVPASEMLRIESRLAEERGLSAIVEATGGVATFPTVIASDGDLSYLLEVAAHEWLHSYLFFHGLGQSYESSGELLTLNETLADIAGRELGGMAYSRLTGKPAPELLRPQAATPPAAGEFSFFAFMRETRVHTEELLASGEIDAAEAYMEARRQELNGRGYRIRKINQAYFAFHGSYGESGSSISPIADELSELRALSEDVADFVGLVRGVRSYGRFQEILASRRAG